jgi:hypothetical protein
VNLHEGELESSAADIDEGHETKRSAYQSGSGRSSGLSQRRRLNRWLQQIASSDAGSLGNTNEPLSSAGAGKWRSLERRADESEKSKHLTNGVTRADHEGHLKQSTKASAQEIARPRESVSRQRKFSQDAANRYTGPKMRLDTDRARSVASRTTAVHAAVIQRVARENVRSRILSEIGWHMEPAWRAGSPSAPRCQVLHRTSCRPGLRRDSTSELIARVHHALRAAEQVSAEAPSFVARARQRTRARVESVWRDRDVMRGQRLSPPPFAAGNEVVRESKPRGFRLRGAWFPRIWRAALSEGRTIPVVARGSPERHAPAAHSIRAIAVRIPALLARWTREEMQWRAVRNAQAPVREEFSRRRPRPDSDLSATAKAIERGVRPLPSLSTLPGSDEIPCAGSLPDSGARAQRIQATSANTSPNRRAADGWRSLKFLRCF